MRMCRPRAGSTREQSPRDTAQPPSLPPFCVAMETEQDSNPLSLQELGHVRAPAQGLRFPNCKWRFYPCPPHRTSPEMTPPGHTEVTLDEFGSSVTLKLTGEARVWAMG